MFLFVLFSEHAQYINTFSKCLYLLPKLFCFYNTFSFASTPFLLHSFLKLQFILAKAHLVFIIGIIKMLLFFNLFPQHFLIFHLQLEDANISFPQLFIIWFVTLSFMQVFILLLTQQLHSGCLLQF